jgi:hypothetical protein
MLSGPSVGAAAVAAAAAALAGYPHATELRLSGCCPRDAGLAAVGALLRASGGRWWRGSRLAALEISSAAAGLPAALPGAAAAAAGPAAGVQLGAAAAGGEWDASGAAAGTAEPRAAPAAGDSGEAAGGPAVPTPVSCAAGLRAPAVAARTAPPLKAAGTDCPGGSGPAPARRRLRLLPRPRTAPAASPGGRAFPLQLGVVQAALRDRAPAREDLPPRVAALRTPLQTRAGCMLDAMERMARVNAALPVGPAAPLEQMCWQPGRPCTTSAAAAPSPAAGPQPPCCFGADALKGFALALGVSGLGLATLTLDFTPLGDAGAELLAPGLRRLAALRELSLRGCGVGPAGARALAAALAAAAAATASAAAAAAGARGNAGAGEAARPQPIAERQGPALRVLALSHNPLGPQGALALCALLRQGGGGLEALRLADVGLGPGDAIPLQVGCVALLGCACKSGRRLRPPVSPQGRPLMCASAGRLPPPPPSPPPRAAGAQGLVAALIAGCPAIAELDLGLNYLGGRVVGGGDMEGGGRGALQPSAVCAPREPLDRPPGPPPPRAPNPNPRRQWRHAAAAAARGAAWAHTPAPHSARQPRRHAAGGSGARGEPRRGGGRPPPLRGRGNSRRRAGPLVRAAG